MADKVDVFARSGTGKRKDRLPEKAPNPEPAGELSIEECAAKTNHAQVPGTGYCACTHAMYDEAEPESVAVAPQVDVRPIDGKFGIKGRAIVNLVSGEEVPEDEPLFLLRARDHHALRALDAYRLIAAEDCNELHIAGVEQVIKLFSAWRAQHPERMKQPGITRHLKLAPTLEQQTGRGPRPPTGRGAGAADRGGTR